MIFCCVCRCRTHFSTSVLYGFQLYNTQNLTVLTAHKFKKTKNSRSKRPGTLKKEKLMGRVICILKSKRYVCS
nr:MAG TPA: hypothetical protein [Caudoviricetes sp.]